MFAPNCFEGKSIMVTGAARGIGKALTIKLDSLGAKVYAVSKNPTNLTALKALCSDQLETVSVDLSDWTSTRDIMATLPVLDGLVNNAGVCYPATFMAATEQDFDSMYNINLKAVVNVTQIVAGKMIQAQQKGSIVNISSISGIKYSPSLAFYGTTKAGVDHLTKVMAAELGPHKIRVNSVNPGCVLTDLLVDLDKGIRSSQTKEENIKHKEDHMNHIPMQKILMDMEGVISAILFYLSQHTPDVTGTILPIDGGFCAV